MPQGTVSETGLRAEVRRCLNLCHPEQHQEYLRQGFTQMEAIRLMETNIVVFQYRFQCWMQHLRSDLKSRESAIQEPQVQMN